MAVIQNGTEVSTYQDAVVAVLDSHDIDRTGLNERRARDSVRQAYRDLPNRHPWTYYYRQRLMQTVASYTTGTVVFDFSGGANELQLTLTTGTWPSWAAFGRVIIDDVHYDVDSRVSDSIITLTSSSNPGADVASTTFEIYRSAYPLPSDFRSLVRIWDVGNQAPLMMVDQSQQHSGLQAFYSSTGTPYHATIRSTGKYLGGREILFGQPPSSICTYDVLYHAAPRVLAIDEYSAGTVAVTATSSAVTGTSTTFPSSCAGAIIRFAAGPVKPSSSLGSLDNADNPMVFQSVIKSYTSATSITLQEGAPQSLSGVGYVISDPLDLEQGVMFTAFLRAAEAEFSRLAGRQDANMRMAMARQSLIEAMEADAPVANEQGQLYSNPISRASVTNSD